MKAKPDNSLEKADARQFSREYAVEMTPHTWWGRAIVVAISIALLSLAFLFFSLLVAIAAALVALTILIGVLKNVSKGPPHSVGQVDEDKSSVIDTQRSGQDGICRPRDSSNS